MVEITISVSLLAVTPTCLMPDTLSILNCSKAFATAASLHTDHLVWSDDVGLIRKHHLLKSSALLRQDSQ